MNLQTFFFTFLFMKWVDSAVTMLPVKTGETLILDIGREVKEWIRVRNGIEEKIQPCLEQKKICNVWIDKEGQVSSDRREHMNENGTLVINKFRASDAGDYFSNDELERIHYTIDGQVWKLARSRISVFAID